jgi:hypothetical protein
MWEDWQLFVKATISGARIAIIPELMLFYRVRLNSMARTYRTFPAFVRLMSELKFMPAGHRFEFLASLVSARRITDSPKEVLYVPTERVREDFYKEFRQLLSYHADFQPTLSRLRRIYRFIRRTIGLAKP